MPEAQMAWHEARMAVLDLETTGVDTDEARIVTAAVGFVGGGKPTDIHTLIAQPDGFEIPDEAAGIHGFTTERAHREGQPLEDVVDIILGTLDSRPEGSAIVVFNAPFDLTILDREARRYGHDPLRIYLDPFLVVDPLVVDRYLEKYRPGKRRLTAQCERWNIELEAAHQAGADAISAARLAYRLAKSGQVVRSPRGPEEEADLNAMTEEWERIRHNLPALHAAQAQWAAWAAAGLEKFFRRGSEKKGVPPQPDRAVEREWPVVPFRAKQMELA